MSESVRIGGIGKNPAIDKINSLNAVDVKNYTVNKMERLLLKKDLFKYKEGVMDVPIDFSKVNWKGESHGGSKEADGKAHGRKRERTAMEGYYLSGGTIMFEDSD